MQELARIDLITDLGGDMDEDALRRRAVAARRSKSAARRGWGASQEAARKYLAAVEYQIEELKEIRRIGGEGALDGKVSAGIEALERDAANIRAEIPTLKPFAEIDSPGASLERGLEGRSQPIVRRVSPTPRKRRRRTALISIISVLAIGAAAIGTEALLHPSVPGAPAQSIAISPDGRTLASVGNGIYLWDVATGRIVATFTGPYSHDVTDLTYSPDGKALATANSQGSINLWDVATGRTVATFTDPNSGGVADVAFSPNGKMLAAADDNNSVYLWDIARHRVVARLQALPLKSNNATQITAAVFSPNGKMLAVALFGNGLYPKEPGGEIWDIATGSIAAKLPPSTAGDEMVYSPRGRTLVIASSGDYLLWDIVNKAIKLTFRDPMSNVSTWVSAGDAAAYSPNGRTLATADGSPNDSAFLWSTDTGRKIATFTDPNSQGVGDIAYAQNGMILATSDGNDHIYLWDVATARITATLSDPSS